MTKKRTYTKEEVDELKQWFEDHHDMIPPSMQIDSSAFTPELSKTIEILFTQAYICHENPKMQGCIRMLEKIKANMEKG